MNRASLLGAVIGAGAALSACDIPPATFDGAGAGASATTSTGGSGGATTSTGGTTMTLSHPTGGGGGGGAGGATTTTTTTTSTTSTTSGGGGTGGGPTGPVVQCNYPMVSDCDPGEVCCYDLTNPYEDFCSNVGSCIPPVEYIEIKCDGDDDCPGKKCCAYFAGDLMGNFQFQQTYCDTACDLEDQEVGACADLGDCINQALVCGTPFAGYDWKFCTTP